MVNKGKARGGNSVKGHGGNLGKALIRDRFGSSRNRRRGESSMLHTSDLNDGYDWGRLNLQSVTEEDSFQEFLSTAVLAGTEFEAEKLNIKFVNPKSSIGLLSKDERIKVLESQEKNKAKMKILRRPKWDDSTTASELDRREKEEFLQWRRSLAALQEEEGLLVTPYEKNLQYWRQLWRVIERSDVVVQIVDARNPLMFRCEDLEAYVKEVDPRKMNVLLINKADFLTEEQRRAWAKYFTDINLKIAFFSATLAEEENKLRDVVEEEISSDEESCETDDEGSEGEKSDDSGLLSCNSEFDTDIEYENTDGCSYTITAIKENSSEILTRDQLADGSSYTITANKENSSEMPTRDQLADDSSYTITANKENSSEMPTRDQLADDSSYTITASQENSSEVLSRDQLISFFKSLYEGETYMENVTTIGLVGYPNVGKSSTINALFMHKRVSVSEMPGKTRHFQTLYLEKDLVLCDCPGLVMPSFICTKAEMILNGILPIDRMRDHVPPITLLGTQIPRHVIEDLYGIMIPPPPEGEDPDRPPLAEEILNAHAYNRGFMTQNAQPDNPRSARYILKDYLKGRLLYCVAPPTMEQEKFHTFPPRKRTISVNKHLPARMVRATRTDKITSEDVDKMFFQNNESHIHVRGAGRKAQGLPRTNINDTSSATGSTQSSVIEGKPWKKFNKHANKKKREKTRRLYADLDEH